MKTTSAISAAAMLSTAFAQWGNFAVINHCNFDLYMWSVAGGEAPSAMITLPGGHPEIGYKEPYRVTDNDSGVSLKVAPYYGPGNSVPPGAITQLEYTVPNQNSPAQASVKNLIFYDVSWVNGNAFKGIPFTMQTSTGQSDHPCPHGTCGIGESCDVGYLWSTDDVKTHACGIQEDIIWTFCPVPGGSLSGPRGLIGKREAAPEPAAAPAANAEADPLAVCVQVGGDGIAQLCPDAATSTTSTTSTSSTPTPKPTTTTTAPPLVALQKPTTPTTTSTTAPAPVPSAPAPIAPAPISNPSGGTVSLAALTNIQMAGVKTWLSWNNVHAKRDLHEHSAHRHNHAAFHRRSRIIKNTA